MTESQPNSTPFFQVKQNEFAAYIRDPKNNPLPADVKPIRMETYRELFFNNVESFLSNNFPVLRQIFREQQWQELAQDFFSTHASQSPYFAEIPEEFLDFLQNQRQVQQDDPVFMLELAHYEWVEMALSISRDSLPVREKKQLNDNDALEISPLAWVLAYQYPVHQISPQYQPSKPPAQATYLIVYRDINDEVYFISVPLITFRLLQIIEQHPKISVTDCLQRIIKEMKTNQSEALYNSGFKILKTLTDKRILI